MYFEQPLQGLYEGTQTPKLVLSDGNCFFYPSVSIIYKADLYDILCPFLSCDCIS